MTRRFHVDATERIDIYEYEPGSVISDTPPNIITIRSRMDMATAGKVSSELMQLGKDNQLEAHIGDHVLALLLHNILGWRGPDFDDLPCTPANIRALPSVNTDPFIEKVANAIGERNKPATSPNLRSDTPPTSAKDGASDSTPSPAPGLSSIRPVSANGTPRSLLQSAITGRQNRSDD